MKILKNIFVFLLLIVKINVKSQEIFTENNADTTKQEFIHQNLSYTYDYNGLKSFISQLSETDYETYQELKPSFNWLKERRKKSIRSFAIGTGVGAVFITAGLTIFRTQEVVDKSSGGIPDLDIKYKPNPFAIGVGIGSFLYGVIKCSQHSIKKKDINYFLEKYRSKETGQKIKVLYGFNPSNKNRNNKYNLGLGYSF